MHGDLVRRVQDAGRGAARRRRLPGEREAAERLGVGRLEREPADGARGRAARPARRRARDSAARRRSARACPGSPRCASEAPSFRCTSACTIDSGCTTTSMPLVGEAEQVVGLDQLEALVHQRRRVDRDLAAHVPGRVRQRRLDARRRRSSSRRHARGTGRRRPSAPAARPSPAARPRSSWKSAECSESTGITRAPGRLGQLPSRARRRRRGSPCLRARGRSPRRASATVGPRPAEPTSAVQHEVGAGLGDQPHDALRPGEHLSPAPRLGRARRPRPGRTAPRASTPCSTAWASRRSQLARRPPGRRPRGRRCRATTSSACVPIEPVEPRITSFRIRVSLGSGAANAQAVAHLDPRRGSGSRIRWPASSRPFDTRSMHRD